MQVPKAPDYDYWAEMLTNYDYWAEMLTNGENRQQLRNKLGVEAAAATAAKKEAAAKEEAAKGAKAPTKAAEGGAAAKAASEAVAKGAAAAVAKGGAAVAVASEATADQQHAVEVPSEQQQQLAEQTAPEQQIEGRPNSKEKSQLNQHVANPDVFAEEGAEEGAASKAEEGEEEAAEAERAAAVVEASAEAAKATRGLMFKKMFSVAPTLGEGTWTLKDVEQALAADGEEPQCKLKRLLVCNGNRHLCWHDWGRRGWKVTNPEEAYTQLNHKKYRLVGVDTEGLQGRKGCTPPPQCGMAMVQLATPDAMLIEIVWDEQTGMLKPSAQLQELLRDEHSIKVTWGLEFSVTWPEFEMLQGIADIQQTKRQVGFAQGGDVPASLTDGLSHVCRSLKPEQGGHVRITKENMRNLIFERNGNNSLSKMTNPDFLAYAGRDALAVLLAACFMGPDKAGSSQTASLSGQVANTKHQKRKRTSPPRTSPPRTEHQERASTGPPRKRTQHEAQLLDDLGWEDTPFYSTVRPDGDLWFATIDFDILVKQGREGLDKFNGRTSTIQRDDTNRKAAIDRACAVALRRLDGESGESPDDESSEDESSGDSDGVRFV